MAHALRPSSVGELLDRTFAFYRRHFLLFVGIAALPNVVLLAFQIVVGLIGRGATGRSGVFLSIALVFAGAFVYLVTTALVQGATVVAVSQILLGRETNVGEAFGRIWSRIGELILLILNMGLRIVLGFLLLVLPGVILALMYALTIPVAVLEERGVSDSLSRSAELTKGYRGRILLIYVLLLVLITIVNALWQVPVGIAVVMTSTVPGQLPLWAQVGLQFGGFVTNSVLGPIMTIAIALVYYDVRVRKEAFDLEHMMQEIDRTTLTPSPVA